MMYTDRIHTSMYEHSNYDKNKNMIRVLFFGGDSWIAKHVRSELEKHSFYCFFASANVENLKEVRQSVQAVRPDSILNFAAYGHKPTDRDPKAAFKTNLQGVENIIEAAAEGDTHIVQAGTGLETRSDSAYALTKLRATELLEKRGNACVLRMFNVYGSGEPKRRLCPTLVKYLGQGLYPPLADPETQMDWVSVDDVAEAFYESVVRKTEGVIEIGGGVAWTLKQTVDEFSSHFQILDEPKWGTYHCSLAQKSYCADLTEAYHKLRWRPKTMFDSGVRDYVRIYKN